MCSAECVDCDIHLQVIRTVEQSVAGPGSVSVSLFCFVLFVCLFVCLFVFYIFILLLTVL